MNEQSRERLAYQAIKDKLTEYTLSYLGAGHVRDLEPYTDATRVKRLLAETAEAKAVLDSGGSVPIPALDGIEQAQRSLGKGLSLTEGQLEAYARFLASVAQLQRYMVRKQEIAPGVASYALSLDLLSDVREDIERSIVNGVVSDDASAALAKLRKKSAVVESRLRKRLDSLLSKYRTQLQEPLVSQRDGRYVLPIKKEYKRTFKGRAYDESASGQTVYMEPDELRDLHDEWLSIQVEEACEVARVLSRLTGILEGCQHPLTQNLEVVGWYDFLFAKAKYARALNAALPEITNKGELVIRRGRHPLLGDQMVPLNVSIGVDYRMLMITGPNTGGKTVTLKTVGLLCMMAQSGLLVPAAQGSVFPVFEKILVDIGDGQSISQSLSTFSSHIKNMREILSQANRRTLVLLDEMASGTDPEEGTGLALAMLESLYAKGSTVIATTHYEEIKRYAARTPGFQNARMAFDTESLRPLYELCMGEAGESCALIIAERLGIPGDIISRSQAFIQEFRMGNPKQKAEPMREQFREQKPDAKAKHVSREETTQEAEHSRPSCAPYQLGDRVWIHAMKKSGIVAQGPDERGNLTVLVQKKPITVNAKRVSLYLSRDQLYPKDYDMSIVLTSKDVRKKRKTMARKHVEGLSIDFPPEP